MSRVVLSDMPLGGQRFSSLGKTVRRVLFGLFLLQFGLVYARLWQPTLVFGAARWPEGLLLVLTAATLLASMNAQLPGQNVLLAGVGIAGLGGLAQIVGVQTGVPFGPFVYTPQIGPKLFGPLPWSVPVLWLVAILAARGTARLLLRRWRTTPNYGLWAIGVSACLIVLFDLGLEPFATQAHAYWTWQPTKLKLDWYSAPCVNFLGWALVAALILAFTTPAFINKKPVKHPPQYHPLAVWLLVNALLATSAALHHLWAAFGVATAAALGVSGLAVYASKAPRSTKA